MVPAANMFCGGLLQPVTAVLVPPQQKMPAHGPGEPSRPERVLVAGCAGRGVPRCPSAARHLPAGSGWKRGATHLVV